MIGVTGIRAFSGAVSQSPSMTDSTANTWRFPSTFWVANLIELFERAAYYGVFIALAVFLTSVVGFTDVRAGRSH